jgi:hypothetical protein
MGFYSEIKPSVHWDKTLKELERAKNGPRSFTIYKIFDKQDEALEFQNQNQKTRVFSFEVHAFNRRSPRIILEYASLLFQLWMSFGSSI